MLIEVFLLLSSLVLLYIGAELALNSSEQIGLRLGLSPLAIGMVLVGMGTSLPELFVSHIATIQDSYQIALGNIIGSNIANTFFILAIASLIIPLKLEDKSLRENLIFHFILSLLIIFNFWFHQKLDIFSLSYLFLFFVIYLYFVYRDMKKEKVVEQVQEEQTENGKFTDKTPVLTFFMLSGFALLYSGGELLVSSGTLVCQYFGISEYVISVILVSIGTSLPELITSVVSALKGKHTDIVVGNIIGSNIFNVAFVLGSLGIYDITFEQPYLYEIAALITVSLFLLSMSYFKKTLNRLSGLVFLGIYAAFIYYWLKVMN